MTELDTTSVASDAARHLWMHFSELGRYANGDVPVMVRGEGAHVFDSNGRRYFDGLAALYCVNVGHGRRRIADAVARQLNELAYFPIWQHATPVATRLATRIAELAPGDLNRVFFTSGGSESVESAWKLVRQYHRLRGNPGKTKIISRAGSYHGTTFGALSITGTPALKEPFGPLVPGAIHAPAVKAYRAEEGAVAHSLACAQAVEDMVLREGAETVGAVIVEPVQNSGGCLVAEPAYFARLREICDEHDLLLISDEVICSWGRLGSWFGCEELSYQPDLITTAKGLTSGYAPLGAVIASDRVAEPFLAPGARFAHGLTFAGHPGAAAAALESIAIIEEEDLLARARSVGARFRAALDELYDVPIVGDVRGMAMFQAVELVADQETKAPFDERQLTLLADRVPAMLFERGLICRAMNRRAPVIQFAPPLISEVDDLEWAAATVRDVLTELTPEVM